MLRRIFMAQLGGIAALRAAASATLNVRVVDAASKRQMPATIAVTTSDNRLITENESFLRGIRSDGNLRLTVPPGITRLTVQRGLDYGAVEHQLELAPGEEHDLIVDLQRRTPLMTEGWLCGDNHAHMIHGESHVAVDFPYVAKAAGAEGLDYLSLAQRWKLPEESPEAIEQACSAASSSDMLLHWNMEAPKNYLRGNVAHCLGHGWTLGMSGRDAGRRSVIEELNGMSAHDYERDELPAPNFESHAYIHSVGGIVSYTHPCRWWTGQWGGRAGYPVEEKKFVSNMAQELPFDTIAGPTYDLIDIMMQAHEGAQNENALRLWFLLLNHGYRIPATASSDATFDNRGRGVPGAVRVYTRVNGPKTISSIQSAMKAGRNFVTSGPLLLWTIGAQTIGDSVPVYREFRGQSRLQVWASGAPGEYLTKAEIFRNGELWHTIPIDAKVAAADLNFEIAERSDAWYVARCYGSNERQVAISNPIYFESRPHQRPRPATARLRVRVTDAGGRGLNGGCDILEYTGRSSRVLATHPIGGGQVEFEAPATARIRVTVDGHLPQIKSIFLDDLRLLQPCLDMRVEKMLDWTTYESIRARLKEARLEFNFG